MRRFVIFGMALVLGCAKPGPAGPAGPTGPQGPAGPSGPAGTTGADGQLRIYGDGSAGDVTLTSSGSLSDLNLQYRSFTIASGTTVTIDSGAVIRCTGTFTNGGTILVSTAASGALSGNNNDYTPPHPGISARVPGYANFCSNCTAGGAAGGQALSVMSARWLVRPGPFGGGGGGIRTYSNGGNGGGTLTVLAQAGITNTGTLSADGAQGLYFGSAGGAGGIVVLASPTYVHNTGSITARGAQGSVGYSNASFPGSGAGGGGGGGIVHLLAPDVIQGSVDVTGGAAGAAATFTPGGFSVAGGGGGGACGGNGGHGGDASNQTPIPALNAATAGANGLSFVSVLNPTSLF